MSTSNFSSRVFLSGFKAFLVLTGFMLILTGELVVEVSCEGGKLLKRDIIIDDKSRNQNVLDFTAPASKSSKAFQNVQQDYGDDQGYFYEDEEDVKITKTIPAIKPEYGGNRIDKNRDLVVKVFVKNQPKTVGSPMNNSPTKPSINPADNNGIDGEDSQALGSTLVMDPKEMKTIFDEVADSILAEADRFYESIAPEKENARLNNDKSSSKTKVSNLYSSSMGFSVVDDSNYVLCTSAE